MNHSDIATAIDAQLDDILSRWHHWQAKHKGGAKGYNTRSLVAGEYRASRQWDDQNGALDCDMESDTMKTVDFQVSEMTEPYRTAAYVLARRLCVGNSAFTSPRLPLDPMERGAIFAEARKILQRRLTSAGVL